VTSNLRSRGLPGDSPGDRVELDVVDEQKEVYSPAWPGAPQCWASWWLGKAACVVKQIIQFNWVSRWVEYSECSEVLYVRLTCWQIRWQYDRAATENAPLSLSSFSSAYPISKQWSIHWRRMLITHRAMQLPSKTLDITLANPWKKFTPSAPNCCRTFV
jgi:hypothetical protein